MNPSREDLKNKLNNLSLKKKSLLKKKVKIVQEINSIKIKEKNLRNELKNIDSSNKMIVSVGFDKRWSTYNCIVKYGDTHFSFYLGKENSIKDKLQQFNHEDISKIGQTLMKNKIKEIVRKVVPNYLKDGNFFKTINFKKLIELYILSGEWNYWKEV